MHFPNTWSVTRDVVLELEQMVIHAVAGRQSVLFIISNTHAPGEDCVPSTTSVIPFDQEELAKIFDLTDRLKGLAICIKLISGNAESTLRCNQGGFSAC